MGKLITELHRLIEDEETEDAIEIEDEEPIDDIEPDGEETIKTSSEDVSRIVKHIEDVERVVDFIDTLTPKLGEGDTVAFEVEIILRKALDKMKKLSDEIYANKE